MLVLSILTWFFGISIQNTHAATAYTLKHNSSTVYPNYALSNFAVNKSIKGIPNCTDRIFWNNINLRSEISSASEFKRSEFPEWNVTDSEMTVANSNTIKGLIWNRIKHLPFLTLAECSRAKTDIVSSPYLGDIEFIIRELAQQPTWSAPAHIPRNHVDLISSSIASQISWTLYLLQDRLSANAITTARQALGDKIFKYLIPTNSISISTILAENPWMKIDHNWNAVCYKGVVTAAILTLKSSEQQRFVKLAWDYSRRYINGFKDDAYAHEGASYWDYGVTNYMMLRDIIYRYSDNVSAVEHMKDIATFDGSISASKVARILSWPFIYRMNSVDNKKGVFAAFGASDVNFNGPGNSVINYINAYTGDNFTRMGSGSLDPIYRIVNKDATPAVSFFAPASGIEYEKVAHDKSYYFKDSEVLVSKFPGKLMAITMKSGTPNLAYEDNDVGSYSLAIDGALITGDPGKLKKYADFTWKTDYRAWSKIINSYGHPVPLVGGNLQIGSKIAKPQVKSVSLSNQANSMRIDLSRLYGLSANENVSRYLFHHNAEDRIAIIDGFKFNSPKTFETAVVTRNKYVIEGSKLLIQAPNSICLQATFSPRVTIIPESIAPALFKRDAADAGTYESFDPFVRIGIRYPNAVLEGSIRTDYKIINNCRLI